MLWPVLGYVATAALSLVLMPSAVVPASRPVERFITNALAWLVIYAATFSAVYVVRRLFARKEQPASGALFSVSLTTACLLSIGIWGGWYGRQSAASSEEIAATQNGNSRPQTAAAIVTAVSSQSSEGIGETDLDQEVLGRLEGWIIDTTVEKTRLVSKSSDFDPVAYRESLHTQSIYMTIAGKRLATTKMRPLGTRIVHVTGFLGNELVRVVCARDSDKEIIVLSRDCGEAISKAFRIELPGN